MSWQRYDILRTVIAVIAGAAILSCDAADRESAEPSRTGQSATGAGAAPADSPRHDQPDGTTADVAGTGRADTAQSGQEPTDRTADLTIYFSRGESTVAVARQTSHGRGGLEAALRELLKGPTEEERAAGLHSWFSDTTAGALRSVSLVEGGRAVVDFEDLRELIPNASTSAGSGMLLRELNSTVFAVPSLESVEYRIEGSCEQFWEWLQYGGCRVQERS